jgi:hypothetical protein
MMIALLAIVAVANYWLIFKAPRMEKTETVNFILIKSKAQERIEKVKEEEDHGPWWIYPIALGIVYLA